jgi:hypothetical protein
VAWLLVVRVQHTRRLEESALKNQVSALGGISILTQHSAPSRPPSKHTSKHAGPWPRQYYPEGPLPLGVWLDGDDGSVGPRRSGGPFATRRRRGRLAETDCPVHARPPAQRSSAGPTLVRRPVPPGEVRCPYRRHSDDHMSDDYLRNDTLVMTT